MQWTIPVTQSAAETIRSLEPAVRDELIAHVDGVSREPAAALVRGTPADAALGLWVSRFKSKVVPGLTVVMHFDWRLEDPPTLTLVCVFHRTAPDPDAP